MGLAVLEDQEDAREAVCARLTRVRELSGLNKKDFSDKLGMSPQAWGEYENGKRDLPLSVAKKLRKAYSIPLEFIYFGNKSDLPHRIATEL
nr:helix-turn-helix transcriptional regulator [Salipiger thiooxidans]